MTDSSIINKIFENEGKLCFLYRPKKNAQMKHPLFIYFIDTYLLSDDYKMKRIITSNKAIYSEKYPESNKQLTVLNQPNWKFLLMFNV